MPLSLNASLANICYCTSLAWKLDTEISVLIIWKVLMYSVLTQAHVSPVFWVWTSQRIRNSLKTLIEDT